MYREILKNRNYVLLQMANMVNRLGDSIDAIALSWLVYEVSQSASSSAINFAINYLPTVCLQPLMGAYVAKLNKHKVMVITDIMRGLVISFLAFNVNNQSVNTNMIYVCTLIMSIVESLRLPASNAIIPLILDSNDYSTGIALSSTISRACELIGSAMAGIIISIFGTSLAIFIDAVSFFLSALFIILMKVKETINQNIIKSSFINNLKDGFKYVLKNKTLLYVMILVSFANLLLVPFNSLESAFISDYYHGDAIFLSIMSVGVTVGSLIGGLIYPLIKDKLSNKILCLSIYLVSGLYCLALLLSGLLIAPYIYISVGLSSLVVGLVASAASCHLSAMIMLKTDQSYISRVGGLFNALGAALMPIGSFIVAIISQYLNVLTIFVGFGIMTLIISIIAIFDKRLEILNE